ncbi:MAG: heme o synthase [Gemmataceae bacterium]|nr:heme o synthase [Gemmataceae bacterium]
MKPESTLSVVRPSPSGRGVGGEGILCAEATPEMRLGAKLADYCELTKPRIAVLVLFTVAAGALLASAHAPDWLLLLNTLLGTGLVAAGASVWNQLIERHSDARMRRTENRPLPAGRITALEACLFGSALGLGGLIYLALTVRQPLAVGVAAFTFASYAFLYTPLKRFTTLNTLVGAVPGALPPIIGWSAVTGRIDAPALVLFLLIFLWQVPHFLAIAWIHRDDYRRAGLRMLPVVDPAGSATARQMLLYCLTLMPISLCPVLFGQGGWLYGLAAVALGLWFFHAAWRFSQDKTHFQARRVLYASLLYLPLMLALLLIEGWRLS